LRKLLAKSEPDACAAVLARGRAVELAEVFKDRRQVLPADADAGVGDPTLDERIVDFLHHRSDADGDFSPFGKLQGIG
jgi:hypothetical protein